MLTVTGTATVIWNFASGLLKDGITTWFKKRGGFHYAIGVTKAPEYLTRSTWDIDKQKIVFDGPIFLEYSIPLNITNKSGVPKYMTVRNVWFSQKEPVILKDGLELPGTSLHPMGNRVDVDGKETTLIKIDPHGMTSIVIRGTNTDPTMGGQPFREWRFIMVDFELAGGDSERLIMKIDDYGDDRVCVPDLKATFPIPDWYPNSQKGESASPELLAMLGIVRD